MLNWSGLCMRFLPIHLCFDLHFSGSHDTWALHSGTHTALRLYTGDPGCSSWSLRTAGSNTSRDWIMKSSAKMLPTAAAPDKISVCDPGMWALWFWSSTGTATRMEAAQMTCKACFRVSRREDEVRRSRSAGCLGECFVASSLLRDFSACIADSCQMTL